MHNSISNNHLRLALLPEPEPHSSAPRAHRSPSRTTSPPRNTRSRSSACARCAVAARPRFAAEQLHRAAAIFAAKLRVLVDQRFGDRLHLPERLIPAGGSNPATLHFTLVKLFTFCTCHGFTSSLLVESVRWILPSRSHTRPQVRSEMSSETPTELDASEGFGSRPSVAFRKCKPVGQYSESAVFLCSTCGSGPPAFRCVPNSFTAPPQSLQRNSVSLRPARLPRSSPSRTAHSRRLLSRGGASLRTRTSFSRSTAIIAPFLRPSCGRA